MVLIADAYSSRARPVLRGRVGAVSAAHPLAVAAGQEILVAGGSAVDATIAAQAVLCVVMPDACGLGGDMLALVCGSDRQVIAINGAGAAPLGLSAVSTDGARSVTVPGIVGAWSAMSKRWGRLPMERLLGPAVRIARTGFKLTPSLWTSVNSQRARLLQGGGAAWSLLSLAAGDLFIQDDLAGLLDAIGHDGAEAFYLGGCARALVGAVQDQGGALSSEDLSRHRTEVRVPIVTRWGNSIIATQPPMSQGVLLSMALCGFDRLGGVPDELLDHVGIELTEAVFAYRSRVAEGEALLSVELPIAMDRARHLGGPRAYLHTAGVAVSDATGLTVSSLVSVFDDFGSCVFVPGCGFTLNNRAGGFTDGLNAAAPGKRPVHTLAPAVVLTDSGVLALATPGADGQVQILLQVLHAALRTGFDLASAVSKPRWRSENGEVLIEEAHPGRAMLGRLGHRLRPLPDGDVRFGGIVCAGLIEAVPVALADWRRETWAGVA